MPEEKPKCFGEWEESEKCKGCRVEKECIDVTSVFEEEEEDELT